jgi:hypothetical protein
MADWLDDSFGHHIYGVRFHGEELIYHNKDCVEIGLHEMLEEIERLRAALHEWDALIRHQYSGSQEAMSDMTYAAQRTAHVLHGKEPWPMQTRVEKLEAALREAREDILLRHNARGSEAAGTDEEAVSFIDAALEGEKTDG